MILFFIQLLQHHAEWVEELSKDVDASIHWRTPSNAFLFLWRHCHFVATLPICGDTANLRNLRCANALKTRNEISAIGIQMKLNQVTRFMTFKVKSARFELGVGQRIAICFLLFYSVVLRKILERYYQLGFHAYPLIINLLRAA